MRRRVRSASSSLAASSPWPAAASDADAGGVVAVAGLQVVGQLGVGGEGGGVQAGRRVMELLDLAPLGQAEAFVAGRRCVTALQEDERICPGRLP